MKRRLIFVLILQFLLFRVAITRTPGVDVKDLDSDDNEITDNSEADYNDSGDDGDDEDGDEDDYDDDKLTSSDNRVTYRSKQSLRRSQSSGENDRDVRYSSSRRSSRRSIARSSCSPRRSSGSRGRYSSRDGSRRHRSSENDRNRRYRRDSYERNSRGYQDRRVDRNEDRHSDRYYDGRRNGASDRYRDRRDKHDRHDDRDDSRESGRRRKKIRRAPVVMPSGQTRNITIPTDSKKWSCGEKSKLYSLSPDGRTGKIDYAIVKQEMESTWTQKPFTSQIIKIEKVVSTCLWNRYKYRRRQVIDEATAANEKMLFFGADAATTLKLTQSGFDERNLNMQSTSWGAGFTLSENSNQAHGYTSLQPDGNRLMLLCRVTLGTTQQYAAGATLAHPPVGYQSVKGTINGHSAYVVYRGEQIYPEYLITYK